MSANRPKLELTFQSFKLKAEDSEAISVIRWPVRIMIVSIAMCLVIAVSSMHPISWGQSLIVWLASL